MQPKKDKNKLFKYQENRTYFKNKTERNIFFILTMVMLILGILYQAGIF